MPAKFSRINPLFFAQLIVWSDLAMFLFVSIKPYNCAACEPCVEIPSQCYQKNKKNQCESVLSFSLRINRFDFFCCPNRFATDCRTNLTRHCFELFISDWKFNFVYIFKHKKIRGKKQAGELILKLYFTILCQGERSRDGKVRGGTRFVDITDIVISRFIYHSDSPNTALQLK